MKIVNSLKTLMLIVLALTFASMTAANVDNRTAQVKAVQFLNSQPGTRFMASSANLRLTHAEASSVKAGCNDFYVFNYDGGGFVIVSGDDRAEEILGYGDGALDMDRIPSNMRWWLSTYKEQIEYLLAHPAEKVNRLSDNSTMLNASTVVSPMLTCIWDQEAPFWNQCPTYNNRSCLTGCVATAMAQVMYFWKYPATLPAISSYKTYTNRITVSALSGTTVDWNNMIDDYTGSYNSTQAAAVATLMRYCGQSCSMDYCTSSQGGSGAYTTDQLEGMKLFGYNSGATYVQRTNYTTSQWTTMMLEDLQARRPILYGGDDGTYGHAFVVDGYDGTKYHINWGWSGEENGYFAISSFMIDSDYDFRQNQDMLYQIYPEGSQIETYAPVMAEASNVGTTSFKATWTDQTPSENVTDYTLYVQAYDPNNVTLLTETFAGVTVSNDGTANIYNSLDNYCDNTGWTGTYVYQGAGGTIKVGSGNYAGSLTTPALDLSTSGGKITVKFNAKYYGNDNSSVVVSCGNASQTVSLTGSAANYTVVLNGVTASTGQKVTFAGTGSKKRFYIDDIEISAGGSSKLSASESGDANNRVITGITSKNYTVNNLTAGGSFKFYVVANYSDGTSKESNVKTVTLEGSSTPTPELVVDPETLTMNANVGETATATFEVLGADLTGNVTLTLNDANGVYTINPTTISKSNAENGATVTVTYAPTVAGSHNATVTVASTGADAVTVTLNGTSTMQTVAPVMAAATNVGTTSFTATWTDATPSAYVRDYTLYVNKVSASGSALLTEAFGGVTAANDGTNRIDESLDDYCDNLGWTGSYVYQAGGGGLKFGNSSNGGSLTTPALDLSDCGGAITVAINGKTYGSDVTTLTISCGNASETVSLTDAAADYTVTLTGVSAAAGQHVTIASTGSKQRYYLYSVNIYSGSGAKAVTETGDANNRVITGITAKTYNVQGLTAGETYKFYVVANYVNNTNASSNIKQVTLEGAAPTPELVVDNESLTMTANVGETVTATFDVLASDLTGNVTVTLDDETGYFSVAPATISIANAEQGATVTVTYAPIAAGDHTATVTIASAGAEDVTVTLNGTAAMLTTAPVMLAATNVGTTSFTATWTDATPAQYVTDYTLYVNKVGASGSALLTETFSGVTAENDGTAHIEEAMDDYCDNAGWTGSYIYQAGGGGIKLGNSSNGGILISPALDLSDCGGAITVVFNGKAYGSDMTVLTISCGNVSETVTLTDAAADYAVTLTGVTAAAGQYVTIASSGSKQRYYLYSVNIYSGSGAKAVTETGDADSRVITGITAKTYTVQGLTAGETYKFYVVANYVDNTNASSNVEQVTLEGAAPTPELIVDNETLTMSANVLETVTATFDVLASDLTGNVTVTLDDETGYFTVAPATISIANAEQGATVTVTYAPTAAGSHTATITLTSDGAEDVTVTVTGTAVMETLAPEMQPADEEYVTTTSFRADWVDVTPEQYVASYTLYVNKKQEEPVGATLLTETFYSEDVPSLDGTRDIGEYDELDENCDNAGWTGYGVYLGAGGGLKLGANGKTGTLTTPALDLSNCGGTVTVKFNAKSYGNDGSSVIVSCGEVSETVELTTEAADYTVVLTGVTTAADQHITFSCIANKKRFYLYSVTIISGNEGAKAVNETGDADSRIITGITSQYYVVENLTPGATYTYYVEANYIDETKAASNVEQVTLLEEQGNHKLGDVNHDGLVDIDDVTILISCVLGNSTQDCCSVCGNVDGIGGLDIEDVTALISMVLGN
jgi:hypothetical protein